MPNLNQRGPLGEGPMTGRRMGRCTNFGASLRNKNVENSGDTADYNPDDFRGRGFGFGFGRGRGGFGRGFGRMNRFRNGGKW
ncbi:MAG TPA: DUF5320 domain-containing protein [Bacteroidales bacterium]|nr:DUF5320 domain-containing protein [Bacteroidales bacterium]HRW96516.1 DUF5320 domain-containing protein [Bacteroidales bacterium]